MSTRLFLLVTDVSTQKLVLVGLAHVKTITPQRGKLHAGAANIDMGENGIVTEESFDEVLGALGVMIAREGART